jgi:hypothetical protein
MNAKEMASTFGVSERTARRHIARGIMPERTRAVGRDGKTYAALRDAYPHSFRPGRPVRLLPIWAWRAMPCVGWHAQSCSHPWISPSCGRSPRRPRAAVGVDDRDRGGAAPAAQGDVAGGVMTTGGRDIR